MRAELVAARERAEHGHTVARKRRSRRYGLTRELKQLHLVNHAWLTMSEPERREERRRHIHAAQLVGAAQRLAFADCCCWVEKTWVAIDPALLQMITDRISLAASSAVWPNTAQVLASQPVSRFAWASVCVCQPMMTFCVVVGFRALRRAVGGVLSTAAEDRFKWLKYV